MLCELVEDVHNATAKEESTHKATLIRIIGRHKNSNVKKMVMNGSIQRPITKKYGLGGHTRSTTTTTTSKTTTTNLFMIVALLSAFTMGFMVSECRKFWDIMYNNIHRVD